MSARPTQTGESPAARLTARPEPTVMHVIDSGGLYGAERVLLDLAAECRARGHRVIVAPLVAPEDAGDPLGDAARAAGLEVEPFVLPDGLRLKEFGSVLETARAERVDVIHSHGYKPNILLALHGRRRRPCAVLATLHGWTARRSLSKMGLYEHLERSLLGRLDQVVAVSPTIKARVPSFAGRHAVSVIPNGIAPRSDTGMPPDPRVSDFVRGRAGILAAGRLSAEKGFDVLIEAAALASSSIPDLRLVVAGEGPERARLEALIRSRGLEDRVLMAGYVPNVRRLMGFFRVYALSSYTEGLPVVILEAMAEGLPVVATEVGSIPQVLDGGRCGRLVGPGDARTLGEALAATLGDAAYAERMRALAQSRFLRFHSSQAMADAYRQLYRALAGRRRVGAAAA